ncbi:MAG: DUF6232 family protein [Thermonemataceae bacterium]
MINLENKSIEETKLYSDVNGVFITKEYLHVNHTNYHIGSIRRFNIYKKATYPIVGVVVAILGILLLLSGLIRMYPSEAVILAWNATLNDITAVAGLVVTIAGVGYALLSQRKYALKINTGGRERDIIVDTDKTYVEQVAEALKKAYKKYQTKQKQTTYQVG